MTLIINNNQKPLTARVGTLAVKRSIQQINVNYKVKINTI